MSVLDNQTKTNNKLMTIKGNLSELNRKVDILLEGSGEPPTPPTTGEFRIRYFYRDRITGVEKIHTQRLNRGENAVPPTDVGDVQENLDLSLRNANPALTFQGWNYTEVELKNVQGDIDVGAMYITTDGKTYFRIRVTRTTGSDITDALTQIIYLNRTTAATLSLDWGDGTATELITTTGNFNRNHTYAQIGDYWVIAWISVGSGTFSFGNGTTSTVVFGGSIQSKRNILINCFIGNGVIEIGFGGLSGLSTCFSLALITIPNSVVTLGNSLNNCVSLKSIIIPNSITSLDGSVFYACRSLIDVSIPNSVVTINDSVFSTCVSLKSIIIPNSITSLGNTSFSNCSSLTSITLPSSVTNIGGNTFGTSSHAFIEWVLESKIPPTLTGITYFTNSIAKMFVPDESLDAYKTATNWISVADYIFPISERRVS